MAELFKAKVITSSGPQDVTVLPIDIISWERAYKQKAGSSSNTGLEDTLFMAWSAAKRQNLTSLDFDGWLETVENIETETETVNPTHAES